MNPTWVVAAGLTVAVLVALVISWLRGDRQTDLGAVSHQWIAEHRLGPGQDSRQ